MNHLLPGFGRFQRSFEQYSVLCPDMIIFDLQRQSGQGLLQTVGEIAAGDIFLVDPLGNLMMRYASDTGMKGMHEDLKRLLKISQIG